METVWILFGVSSKADTIEELAEAARESRPGDAGIRYDRYTITEWGVQTALPDANKEEREHDYDD